MKIKVFFSELVAVTLHVQIFGHTDVTGETVSKTELSPTSSRDIIDGLSIEIRDILDAFQRPKPEISILRSNKQLDDPFNVPNTSVSFGLGSGKFYNISVHGLSNFTLESMNSVLDQMEVNTVTKSKKIYILGKNSIDTVLGIQSQGDLNITLINVTTESTVILFGNSDGSVVANQSISEITYDDLIVTSSSTELLQTVLNGFGTAVFSSLKLYIIKQSEEYAIREVNMHLSHISKMPTTIQDFTVMDLAIIEGRKFVAHNYEPFVINKILDQDNQFFTVSVGPVNVKGVSKFSRVGSVPVNLENGNIVIFLTLKTRILKGHSKFFYDFGKIGILREGMAFFTISHLQFKSKISQSVDLRDKPIIDQLELEIGTIDIHLDGNGMFDYFVETLSNFLPQMLRQIIIDALEEPVRQKIQQEILDKISISKLISTQVLVDSFLPSSF